MIDISTECGGIKAPNPFWLASAPPTNSADQVLRAFESGWGGAVWKTLGNDPPVINTSSRYGGYDFGGVKLVGLNNIELITDRPLEDNLKEIRLVKKEFPDRAVVVSVMYPCNDMEAAKTLLKKVEDTGCDGIEVNLGCPHGMSERGMGSAIGQVPEYTELATRIAKETVKIPVLIKLTPNITDIRYPARAAKKGGADGVSLINTINSIMGFDLETLKPKFSVEGKIAHGGYCGPAVKPIALNMVASIATDPELENIPISGIGGISTWADAVEFMLLGCTSVQVCTAVMHYGFRIVEDMVDGLKNWMKKHNFKTLNDFVGVMRNTYTDWKNLNLHYKVVASINEEKCIGCSLCYVACNDAAHQCIVMEGNGRKVARVIEELCVGCNLCSLVCPVDGCINMKEIDTKLKPLSWEEYVKNGMKGYSPIYPSYHIPQNSPVKNKL